ncbi:MAG: DNA recombination protein RmuC [Propionicimonas sp.]|nr:DNA recombination protein RmuC [Propionicimonas sp.]
MEQIGQLVTGLVVGLVVGTIAVWFVLRARQGTASATAAGDTERARAELAQARAEAAQSRSELSREAADAARARQEAAEARAERADAFAQLADAKSATSAALAQRDAERARAEEVAALREQVVTQFKALSAEALERQGRQADATAEQRQKQTDALLGPVKESLERFNTRLAEVEQGRVELASSLKEQVAAVQLTGEQLKRETNALVTALRKPQVRGAWGELQLKRVVEIAGMLDHCDFVQQQTAQTSAGATIRPDLKVTLAEGKFVYVDSKVPLTSFLDAHEAADERDREHHLKQFAKNVKSHIDQLSGKNYFKAEGSTPEFVVLFMPSEALAAEAYSILPDLHEYANQRAIVLATPTTLIAMLRTIAYSWRQTALADSAQQVFELGRELYDRLGVLGKHFDKVGRSLTSAVGAYNDAVGSIEGRVFPTARKLRDLQVVADKELAPVHASDAAVRPLTASELVEDAVSVPALVGRRPALDEARRPQPTLDELVADERGPQPPAAVAETA